LSNVCSTHPFAKHIHFYVFIAVYYGINIDVMLFAGITWWLWLHGG